MTEIFSPNVELPKPPEVIGPAELEEVLRRARAPIIREGFAEPWAEDAAAFDPAQAGWEQAAGNVLAKIQKMQSSGLVQLTPEGLTPKQAAEKAGEAAKLAEANARAAELAEQLRQRLAAGAAPRPPVEAPPPPAEAEEPASGGPTAEEAAAGLRAAAGFGTQVLHEGQIVIPPAEAEIEISASVAGAGGKMRKFFESERGRTVLVGAEFVAGSAVGVAIAEILKLGPGREAGIVVAAQSVLGLSRLVTEIGARTVEGAEARFPRFARLSARLAGEKGLAGVLRGGKTLATGIQYRPFVAGLSAGIIGHSAFEMVTGHSIFPDVNAAEPTPGPAAVSTETPTATATETPTGTSTPDATPSPIPDATPVSPEATQIPDGGEVGGPEMVGGQAPAEQVGPQHPEVGRLPGGEEAVIPAEDLLAQQTAEAATRVVEVQPGDTLTGLIDAAGGDAYGKDFTDTVLQSADVLTGPQNPNRDMASALIDFIKAHPDGVNWRDAINGVGDLAKEMVGGVPLKDAIAQATRMIYPGQEMKIVVGAAMP